MYNISMLRHRFSNERWGGRPEPPPSLIYKDATFLTKIRTIAFCSDAKVFLDCERV